MYHLAVRRALEKEGWLVTDDPLYFDFEDFHIMLDLGAERVVACERAGQKIAVEIKSFIQASRIHEYHRALGQYRTYQAALELRDADRKMYLAAPDGLYHTFFQNELIQYTIKRNEVALLLYDSENEVITQWLPKPI
jgi:hypothetical protein